MFTFQSRADSKGHDTMINPNSVEKIKPCYNGAHTEVYVKGPYLDQFHGADFIAHEPPATFLYRLLRARTS